MAQSALGGDASKAFYDLFLTVDLLEDGLGERTLSEFLDDETLIGVAVGNLRALGEISRRISPGMRALHPELPWPFLDSFARDEVDPRAAWALVRQRVLPMKDSLQRALERALRGGASRFRLSEGEFSI